MYIMMQIAIVERYRSKFNSSPQYENRMKVKIRRNSCPYLCNYCIVVVITTHNYYNLSPHAAGIDLQLIITLVLIACYYSLILSSVPQKAGNFNPGFLITGRLTQSASSEINYFLAKPTFSCGNKLA